MGNAALKGDTKKYTTLSPKEMNELHELIIAEYPFLSNVYESMLVTDNTKPDCPIVFANDQFEIMTLYSKEEILGRNCRFLQGKHTDRNLVKKIRHSVDNGLEMDVEILNYRKDGVPFWNSFLMLPVHQKGQKTGKVTHFIAIQKDITVLKEINSEPKLWTPVEVAMWMEKNGFGEYAVNVIDKAVDGNKLLSLEKSDLSFIGIVFASDQKRFMDLLSTIQEKKTEVKKSTSIPKGLDSYSRNDESDGSHSPPASPITVKGGKEFWQRERPSTDKMVLKCYIEGREPWLLLVDQDFTLNKLRQRIEKSFGAYRITYKEDDYELDINDESDLKGILLMNHGSTISLYLHRLEIRLPKSSTQYLDTLPLPILLVDAAGYVLYANDDGFSLFGYSSKKDLRGKKFQTLVSSPISNFPPTTKSEQIDISFINKNGEFRKFKMIMTISNGGIYSLCFK